MVHRHRNLKAVLTTGYIMFYKIIHLKHPTSFFIIFLVSGKEFKWPLTQKQYLYFLRSIMPLTNKEKQRLYLERLKASGEYDEYKMKKAVSMRKSRQRRKRLESTMPKRVLNQLIRERWEDTKKWVAKHRQKKKEAKSTATSQKDAAPFRSAQAFA